MQLNKYLATCGILSRRKAADIIKNGLVSVNNEIITNPAYQVKEGDRVKYQNKILKPERKVYIILNKPKGYISTHADELGRKTVFDLIQDLPENLHSIGRLDLDTTGVLILTNDGDLTQKLAHPSFNIKKTYKVSVDKPINETQGAQLLKGIYLEDGFIKPDKLFFRNTSSIITLHSGKKHIVRRIFEHLGFKVRKLERIDFAGITKKNLPIGSWRHLTMHEISKLKKLQ